MWIIGRESDKWGAQDKYVRENVFAEAKAISEKNPETVVTISGECRCRMKLQDGEVIWEEKDLGAFYKIDETDKSSLIGAIVFASLGVIEEWMSYEDATIPKHWDLPVELLLMRYKTSLA